MESSGAVEQFASIMKSAGKSLSNALSDCKEAVANIEGVQMYISTSQRKLRRQHSIARRRSFLRRFYSDNSDDEDEAKTPTTICDGWNQLQSWVKSRVNNYADTMTNRIASDAYNVKTDVETTNASEKVTKDKIDEPTPLATAEPTVTVHSSDVSVDTPAATESSSHSEKTKPKTKHFKALKKLFRRNKKHKETTGNKSAFSQKTTLDISLDNYLDVNHRLPGYDLSSIPGIIPLQMDTDPEAFAPKSRSS